MYNLRYITFETLESNYLKSYWLIFMNILWKTTHKWYENSMKKYKCKWWISDTDELVLAEITITQKVDRWRVYNKKNKLDF